MGLEQNGWLLNSCWTLSSKPTCLYELLLIHWSHDHGRQRTTQSGTIPATHTAITSTLTGTGW